MRAQWGGDSELAAPGIRVLPMSEGHLTEVARIERDSFPTPWSVDAFRREIAVSRPGTWCRVALIGRSVVGFVVAWFVVDEVQLAKIAVSPRARRQGVGRRLLEALLRDARAAGMRSVTLEVRATNAAAEPLYREYGFVETGIRSGYYEDAHGREDARLMTLVLIDPDG